MKILMVSSFLPYPLINGGNIRLYNLLKNLSPEYEVTLICEKRNFQTGEDIEQVEKVCREVVTVSRKKQWTISNILRSGFSFDPFLIVGHTSSEMKNKIGEELMKNSFDLIHVETFYVMQNLPRISIPVVLVEHNIEHSVYKRFVNQSTFFLKPFLNLDVWKMSQKEKSFWDKAKVLVAVSETEKRLMNADEVVPNGVDTEKFEFQSSDAKVQNKEKRILFIGDFKWIENRDTAKWIIKEIWPKLKRILDPDVKLWIVGKEIPTVIKDLTKDPSVIFDENAPEDTVLIYRKTFVLLSPIRIGGGTSFKILEAMASGVPVVTTSLGAEGITSGNEVIRVNNPEEILRAVAKLFEDIIYYRNMTGNARKLVEEKYNWKKITKKLEAVYQGAVKND